MIIQGQVTTHEEKRHGFVDGDHVKFKEVEGMTEVNGQQFEIKVLSPFAFQIKADTTNFGKYIRNGLAEQVKVPQFVNFRGLQESLQAPTGGEIPPFENPDLDKWGRPEHLHIAMNALLDYVEAQGRLPRLNNEEDAIEVLRLYKAQNDSTLDIEGKVKVDEVNEDLVKNIARFADAQTSPHCCLLWWHSRPRNREIHRKVHAIETVAPL